MADLCMCGHEEREHGTCGREPCLSCLDAPAAFGCHTYRRSPLSAFRGPAVVMSREEAAGWLRALVGNADGTQGNARPMARLLARDARANLDMGDHESAAACYLAARILRAVRP